MHQIISANYPVVQNNRVLVGHSFKEFYTSDWFSCVQSCYDEPECISYNYQRSGNYIDLCELNDSGVEALCDRDKSLIYSSGFVFQQIRETKLSKDDLNIQHTGLIVEQSTESTTATSADIGTQANLLSPLIKSPIDSYSSDKSRP
ncbi:uncharacterized protein LOC111341641 [Stylophora pistillata]|uniref:uncharacterized protein LOC111341641 n=1 Tax=Stylophora pistillata TaxID=50429 RepID=UPI000C050E89|nr:uncharacterized protein LOC111341641 [Stylophora pistillata]